MTSLPIIVTTAVVVGVVLLIAVVLRNKQLSSGNDFDSRWQSVDVLAFMNLVDPNEEEFLRRHLTSADFRQLQRERVVVMWEYLSRLAANSRLMMQAGQIVQHSQKSSSRAAANAFVAQAARLRMSIFAAECYLLLRYVAPMSRNPVLDVIRRYDSLTQSFQQRWSQEGLGHQSIAS